MAENHQPPSLEELRTAAEQAEADRLAFLDQVEPPLTDEQSAHLGELTTKALVTKSDLIDVQRATGSTAPSGQPAGRSQAR